MTADPNDHIAGIRAQIADMLDLRPDQIADEDNLLDHGLDSIRIMSLAEELRAAGRDVNFAEMAEEPTLERWRHLLTSG